MATEFNLRYGFLANHHLLTKKLDTEALLPDLISCGLISPEEEQLILHEVTGSQKNDRLLMILHRRGTVDSGIFDKLFKLLSDESVSAGQLLEDVLEKIKADSRDEVVKSRFGYSTSKLEVGDNVSLRHFEDKIVDALTVSEILPQLVSYGIVNLSENVLIRSMPLERDKAKELLKIIRKRGTSAFDKFVDVLLESETQSFLGKLLKSGSWKSEMNDDDYVKEVLKRAHVPPRHGVYVERKEKIKKIQNELYKLKDEDGWVVVHGMAGFGKTVLAAEAVRDATLLREVFPGGVHWLTVGQMTNSRGELDSGKLLSKLQTVILRLDKNKTYRPPNIEAATDYLQQVVSDQHPRSLLILDDVWSFEVARAFAVRCRTMVTSRNAAVANGIPTAQLHSVSVSEGFTIEEGRCLLAQWLKVKPEQLSPHTDEILEFCRGSPMAIALIGAILKRNASEQKWKSILDKLKKSHYHLHASINLKDWNYQHPTLNASIELSVESLSGELREYLNLLVVFDYDTLIPSRALETIWNKDDIETEKYMYDLVEYSLVQQGNPGALNPDSIIYYVHDILLDYLKDTIPKDKQGEYHKLVVKRYTDKCENAYACLEDDGYVFQKLPFHIAASGDFELLGQLLSNLKWLLSTVENGAANSLLACYRDYRHQVPERFSAEVQHFELFLSGHMYALTDQPPREDVIQLALLLPDTSEVYQQAQGIVREQRKTSWFDWMNKESDPEKYALKLRVHQDGVRHCQYSADGTKVLSCASLEVKLWDSSTGMVSADFIGHKDLVTCCALSASGKLVVSSSEDHTVKVWDVSSKRLLCDFKGHRYGVQCCTFSPNEKMVMSGDISSTVLIWESRTGKVLYHWCSGMLSPALTPTEMSNEPPTFLPPQRSSSSTSHESEIGEGVLSCAFSPTETSVVTTAQNGAVRVWDLNGLVIHNMRGHTGFVNCCVFSKNGDLLATSSQDCTAKVWNVHDGTCEWDLDHTQVPVLCCDFSPDGTKLLTGDVEGSVKIWSLKKPCGVLLNDLSLHCDWVTCVLFSPPNGQHILSASDNGLIKILWNEDEDGCVDDVTELNAPLVPHYHRRFTVHFEKSAAGWEPTIVCYIPKEKKLQLLRGQKAEVVLSSLPIGLGFTPRCWVISNNGKMIVVGYEEGMIQMLQLYQSDSGKWSTLELWREETAHKNSVLKCYFSPDDSRVASCSKDQHKMWKTKDGCSTASISGRGVGVRPMIFFKDNCRVASAQETAVLIWNITNGKHFLTLQGIVDSKDHSILCINLSEDNTRLIASATSGLVVVWNTESGAIVMNSLLVPMTPCARSCALSVTGDMAVAGFDDGSLKIWNVERRKEVASQSTGSAYWMIDVAFSPNGTQVVTLCDSIQWWRSDGNHIKKLMLKGTFGKYLRFSSDFSTFVTIDNAGLLYIFNIIH